MFLHSKIKYQNIFWAILPAFLLLIGSCSGNKTSNIFKEDYLNVDAFQNTLYQKLKPIDTTDTLLQKRLLTDMDLNVTYAYQLSTYKPFWFDKSGLIEAGAALPYHLQMLTYDGLDPEDYHLSRIRQIIRKVKNSKVGVLDSVEDWDAEMTKAYLSAAHDLLFGTGQINSEDTSWHIPNDKQFNGAAVLSRQMDTSNKFPSFDSFRPQLACYQQMRAAVKKWEGLNQDSIYLNTKKHLTLHQDSLIFKVLHKEFGRPYTLFNKDTLSALIATYQRMHQLNITGKADQSTLSSLKELPDYYMQRLFLNMERLREMPRLPGKEYVWVNIPMMKMKYVRDGKLLFQTKAVVGTVKRKTPSLSALMTNVIFNPTWTVPPTIVANDIARGIRRSGSRYLLEKGLRALNDRGEEVTHSVTAANYKEFTYQQPAGPDNALGQIKFNLPNPWDIYLHDTPHENAFSRQIRTLSSGCIRLQDPAGFAQTLLHYTPEQTDSLIQTGTTQSVKLKPPVPVYIIYLTVDADFEHGGLDYLHDIYQKD